MLPAVMLLCSATLGQAPPAFEATSTDPSPIHGLLEGIGPDWAITLRDNEKQLVVPAGKLVGLRQADRPLPAWPTGGLIILANGDRISGEVLGGDDRAISFAPRFVARRDAVPWAIPLSAVTAVWFASPPAGMPLEPSQYPWAEAANRRDAILMRNGDVIRGVVEAFAFEPQGARVKTGTATTNLPFAQSAAISFDPSIARVRKPKGPYARLVLADGSRITVNSAKADGTSLTGATPYGTKFEAALSDVIALDVLQGKAVYLSDLKPKKAAAESYNGLQWPWVADRSVKGNPLRIGPHTFDKGLGTHPKTTLSYDLAGKYHRFEASVGLDLLTGRRGLADIRVQVDGKDIPVDALRGITLATSPVAIHVDVAGAKELTLVIEFGITGDVQSDVNWGNARLIE